MTLLWLCVLWVMASAVVAMLPMRRQYIPGVILLIAAPILIVMVAIEVNWLFALFALVAFVSMFRNPIRYLAGRLRGGKPEVPDE